MKKGYTHITVILDRSGSMGIIRDDTIGGLNAFVDRQAAEPGDATLTLVQFDSGDPYEVRLHFMPIGEVRALNPETYVPRGMTPLLDALGRAINDIECGIAKLEEGRRPETVVVAVITDGQENSSTEFTKPQVEKMVGRKSAEGWEFIFLSADLSAIEDAQQLGFRQDATALFDKSPEGVACCMEMLSSRVSEKRIAPDDA
ncbi:vWA domain-containing protein [Pelodictyon luteolum]|uniref:VWA domain-containing protein n=1 Tax=Chlorobium luteolum (strain DSM 273 / BCRC 81028 / 2530) TaxID=319225 RepID=Q3B5G7_CHLL3|nr:vWA domain-containing protein [Pelodictyon luteolum]ABB23414.1 conserved hypothetical protein [Pelodictyon luteolum DSM 273]